MTLGYVPSAREILEYYGSDAEPNPKESIFNYSKNREILLVLGPTAFKRGKRFRWLRSPDDFLRMAKATLLREANQKAPRRYPAFHGTIRKHGHPRTRSSGRFRDIADFVIDIDIKTGYRKAFKAGKAVTRLYDKYDLPYFVKFSGGTGPHIIIPAEAFPEECGSFENVSKKLLQFVIKKTRISRIDQSFSNPHHFLRLPYSVHERTALVSIPLSRDGYSNFKPSMAEIPNVQVEKEICQITKQSAENVRNFCDEAEGSFKEERRFKFPFGRLGK